MVIRKDDRVSTVLRADESLVDVFVSLSPAFERLRSPAMRKVMSRLVTVEQAARIARVDPDELVQRLNARGSAAREEAASGPSAAVEDPKSSSDGEASGAGRDAQPPNAPEALARIASDDVVHLDVREDLRRGEEPFSRIMAARREVPDGGALCVRAIFEPVPLYAVMEKQGLGHYTEELGDEDWRVWFYPAAEPPDQRSNGAPSGTPTGVDTGAVPDDPAEPKEVDQHGNPDGVDDPNVVVLDVRGLEPPEPMARTLAALEELPPDGTLVQLNVRVPQFLLPQLEERGFTYEIREQEPGLVRVFMRRAQSASVAANPTD